MSFWTWLIKTPTFCFCIPVRFGIIVISLFCILFGGVVSLGVWYQVSVGSSMDSRMQLAFVVAGIVETLLLVSSILGFAGAVARKQLFVMIYAYFFFCHFVVNVFIVAYFLYVVNDVADTAITRACKDAIRDSDAEDQCSNFLDIGRNVITGVGVALLLVEFFGVVIITRYMHQIKSEKRELRASRMAARNSGFKRPSSHDRIQSEVGLGLLNADRAPQDFNPYDEVHAMSPIPSHGHGKDNTTDTSYNTPHTQFAGDTAYGGGTWTHEDLASQEKGRISAREAAAEREAPTLDIATGSTDGHGASSLQRAMDAIPTAYNSEPMPSPYEAPRENPHGSLTIPFIPPPPSHFDSHQSTANSAYLIPPLHQASLPVTSPTPLAPSSIPPSVTRYALSDGPSRSNTGSAPPTYDFVGEPLGDAKHR